jgi:hypothetical protein
LQVIFMCDTCCRLLRCLLVGTQVPWHGLDADWHQSLSPRSLLIVLGVCVHAQAGTGKESPIDVVAGCDRQRITNWHYGSLAAHEGQFQRASKLLILLKGIRGCALGVMFLEWKCIWIFLSNQPLFLTYASSVYICVKWELSCRGPLLFTS